MAKPKWIDKSKCLTCDGRGVTMNNGKERICLACRGTGRANPGLV